MERSGRQRPAARETGGVAKAYLTLYNLVQAVGWYYVVGSLLWLALSEGLHSAFVNAWPRVSPVVIALQWASFLELVHVFLGLVPGGAMATFAQVIGRNHLLLAAVVRVPEVQQTALTFFLFLFWGSIELVRFPFYALSLHDACPYFLKWLRYSLFAIVYPFGYGTEVALYWTMLPYAENLYRIAMPNEWNFAFHYPTFLVIFMIGSLPFFLQNYFYMFAQRRSKLGPSAGEKRR